MTDQMPSVTGEESSEEQRKKILQATKRKREELEAEQNAMLEAVAEGEEFDVESYETVSLGGVTLKVKAWFPGDTLEEVADMGELAKESEFKAAKPAIRTNINALTNMTEMIDGGTQRFTSKERIRQFWNNYFQKYGDQGIQQAVETVIGPAEDNSDTEDTMKSFPSAETEDPRDRSPREWRS